MLPASLEIVRKNCKLRLTYTQKHKSTENTKTQPETFDGNYLFIELLISVNSFHNIAPISSAKTSPL